MNELDDPKPRAAECGFIGGVFWALYAVTIVALPCGVVFLSVKSLICCTQSKFELFAFASMAAMFAVLAVLLLVFILAIVWPLVIDIYDWVSRRIGRAK